MERFSQTSSVKLAFSLMENVYGEELEKSRMLVAGSAVIYSSLLTALTFLQNGIPTGGCSLKLVGRAGLRSCCLTSWESDYRFK
jgi:hypothetical protein